MIITSNIPQYYSYKDIYTEYLYAKELHACLTHRFSNDTMFVGRTGRLDVLYNQMTKLYVIIETLTELFNDNPIYACDISITDEEYLPVVIDTDVEEKYVGYFNKLFSCLRTTIDSIKTCKKGIDKQFIIERCETVYNSGSNGDDGCIVGDYNNDYNNDYFTEVCNDNSVPKSLIVCDTFYHIDSSDLSANQVILSDVNGLSVGMNVELGHSLDNVTYESKVFTITEIVSHRLTLSGNVLSYDGYRNLMIVDSIRYNVLFTPTIAFTSLSGRSYGLSGDHSYIPNFSSIVVTDNDGNEFYDTIYSVEYDVKIDTTYLRTVLIGVELSDIAKFEITDHIVDSSYC